jgi:hypothetical protein
VDDLNRTLEAAQRADGEMIAQLASLQRTKNEGFVVDLPLSVGAAWSRALAGSSGAALAAELRTPLAPGRLGGSMRDASTAFAAALVLAWAVGARLRTSRFCGRCGERQCVPCGSGVVREVCEDCTRLFDHPEKTDRALRVQRIEELREREQRLRRIATLTSIALPGAAGLLAERPLRGLLGAVCFALACAAVVWRSGVVPDPLVAGAAAPVAFLGVATLAGLLYAASIALCLRARRSRLERRAVGQPARLRHRGHLPADRAAAEDGRAGALQGQPPRPAGLRPGVRRGGPSRRVAGR